jgi:hypothetical protein
MIFAPNKELRKSENWSAVYLGPTYGLKKAKVWCQSNYPNNKWYYWYGSNKFWFDDSKIATEFALRFAGQ